MLQVPLNKVGRLGFSKYDILPRFKEICFREQPSKGVLEKRYHKILKKNVQ